ncbi:MAG: RDD family protein [Vicingaceae bacterium]|nr:RDD family protein [Vicingaceae bacterium]
MLKEQRPSIFKRVLALFIDFIILGIVGSILGYFLEDFFVSLGVYGTLVGSTITILYFGILQSSIGSGQSLGKKVIKAKLTDLNGNYLTPGQSFLRSVILFLPLMNVGIFADGKGMIIALSLIIALIFSGIYFILVNKSRRSLHDILIRSVVVYRNVTELEIDVKNDVTMKKIIPIGIIILLIMVNSIYQLFAENKLTELIKAKVMVEKLDGVIVVNQIQSNKSTTTVYGSENPPYEYSSVNMTVRLNNKEGVSSYDSKYFDEIHEIILSEVPEAKEMSAVIISLNYGYTIGIASKTKSISKSFEN